ncbi:polygalacturonase QRT2-like isoform X2 [Sesamum indicum]|nr:polygalacturonase QRT2-like isoform X2 [Sesamum indicum]XP_020549330.1 polygalacturonase QRT2-like isoform X2 [Sesamum indicum]XP_020549331.1 polygalacturonase QRT2-like isoform X2 [Sesamum indicum]XP_020549332.1 polygalacturonase QRT2-like isoform X2 [Sesamum indicum]XP_020549333.1 polygalacturonase QRT2-like isoform X2 [Sesamum indicum]
MDYGATSDDLTDDSQAFLEAWDDACSASVESSRVYVPAEKTFVVDPITFHGPCYASTINFAISGRIMAPESPSSWDGGDASQWLGFKNVNGLKVDGFGFGLIDGQGKGWWDQSCRYHPRLKQCTTLAPTALKFVSCNESSVSNMKFTNSAQTHILVRGCNSFSIDNVMIESPGNSPNTDGIHIQSSQHVLITNSRIATGDDCVSIGDHTSNIEIENVECGPGHGISIGSLGRGGNYVQVQNILVTDAFFNGTTNGARIKTWQVGRGYVRDVTFQNLLFNHVQNPIIIDQNYCNVRNACKEQETGVQISNVNYKEVLGTSTTDIAININCSRSVPCFGISMESIQLLSAEVGKQVTANCSNAYGEEVDVVPGPCLLD